MAIYLQNLPSFNKENFSNFQTDSSQICPSKKTFLACSPDYDYSSEQLIVNSQYNIIIQYLEKQSREKVSVCPDRGRKREISNVMKTTDETPDDLSKIQKRRKILQNSVDNLDDSSVLEEQVSSDSEQTGHY